MDLTLLIENVKLTFFSPSNHSCTQSFTFLITFVFLLFLPSECKFPGNTGSQKNLSGHAPAFGPTVHPAAVPDTGPAGQGDGSEGWESGQAHTDPRSCRWGRRRSWTKRCGLWRLQGKTLIISLSWHGLEDILEDTWGCNNVGTEGQGESNSVTAALVPLSHLSRPIASQRLAHVGLSYWSSVHPLMFWGT